MSDLDTAINVADDFHAALKTEKGPSMDLMREFQIVRNLNDDEEIEVWAHAIGMDLQTLSDGIKNGDLSRLSDTNREVYRLMVQIYQSDTPEMEKDLENYFKTGQHRKLSL